MNPVFGGRLAGWFSVLLSTGVMDGTLFPAESVEGFKIEKVIKHATSFPGGLYNTSFVFMMNQGTYDKLPADVKERLAHGDRGSVK